MNLLQEYEKWVTDKSSVFKNIIYIYIFFLNQHLRCAQYKHSSNTSIQRTATQYKTSNAPDTDLTPPTQEQNAKEKKENERESRVGVPTAE